MKLNPESIARASSRRPVVTLIIWVVVFMAAGVSSSTLLNDALTTDFDFTNNPEAKQAITVLEDAQLTRDVATESFVITAAEGSSIEDPAFVAHVNEVLGQVSALGDEVVQASPPAFPLPEEVAANPEAAALGPIPAEDGSAVLFTVVLAASRRGGPAARDDRRGDDRRRRRDLLHRPGQLDRGLPQDLGRGPSHR
jgi:hypothetical protein